MNDQPTMMIQPQMDAGDDELIIPQDLTEWAEACRLMEWVEEEVNRLDWENPEVQRLIKQNPDFHPKALLNLLTYAYATGVFSKDEIVRRCYSETVYKLICEKQAPMPSELMRFRREHRGLLRGLIYQVLVRALRHKYVGDAFLPPGLKRYLVDNAVERLTLARHMDVSEE
jgi:hypothetical protein